MTNEMRTKLLTAGSSKEAAELVKDNGQVITEEEVEHLWEEITKHREQEGQELSIDELEAVSGGADRDWLIEGCAATVEPGSWCGSNDSCHIWDVTYDNPPKDICPKCGGGMTKSIDDNIVRYTCAVCGYIKEEKINNVGTGF